MHWNTVSPLLRDTLICLMKEPAFASFRLVGGTCLSLHWGHRISVDIDLFTDEPYDSIDFGAIDKWLREQFAVVDTHIAGAIGMGLSYYVGHQSNQLVKLDLYYTDQFIRPVILQKAIRMADTADIVAMKMEIMTRGGRKKDFWDLHAAHDYYSIPQMLDFYQERYPYNHTRNEVVEALNRFELADDDFDPICLQGKHWELIKYDFFHWLSEPGI